MRTACDSITNSMEAEARVLVGQHDAAIKATEVLIARAPFNAILQLCGAVAVGAARNTLGMFDEAAAQLSESADEAHRLSAFFLELMLAMDLHRLALDRPGEGGAAATLGAVGRAVMSMPEALEDLRPVLAARSLDIDDTVAAAPSVHTAGAVKEAGVAA